MGAPRRSSEVSLARPVLIAIGASLLLLISLKLGTTSAGKFSASAVFLIEGLRSTDASIPMMPADEGQIFKISQTGS